MITPINTISLYSRFEKSVFFTIPIEEYADQLLHASTYIIIVYIRFRWCVRKEYYNNIKILDESAGYGRVHTCGSEDNIASNTMHRVGTKCI